MASLSLTPSSGIGNMIVRSDIQLDFYTDKGGKMPKYLIKGSYTQEGLSGLVKDGGSKRRATVENLVRNMGGVLESFYYAFGDDDIVAIVELPDDASVSAVSLMVGATGAAAIDTTVLIEPETIDEAVKKTVDYTPPGQ